MPLNNNGNALHGGPAGFSGKVWTGKEIPDGVEMTLVSPDGDMGFPGTLTARVRYTVEGKSLKIQLHCDDDQADGGESYQPQLLQPGGGWEGNDP